MRILRRLLGIGIPVALVWLGWQLAGRNSSLVTIDFLVGESGDVSLWAALATSFAAGAAVAGLASLYQLARLGLVTRRYRKTVDGLEAEVHQLRNLPLATEELALGGSAGDAAREPTPGSALERGA
jgi:uncharacterized membrane protein YciS (DUF1049 family)